MKRLWQGLLISVYQLYSEIPTIEKARIELKQLNMFSNSSLEEMCAIQTNDSGFSSWAAAFVTVQNSDLTLDKKLDAFTNLIALGVNQTNAEDVGLNEIIKNKLRDVERLTQKGKMSKICSYNELKVAFEEHSSSSNSSE